MSPEGASTAGVDAAGREVMGPQRFRKRPIEVDAIQYDGPSIVEDIDPATAPWYSAEFASLRKFVGGPFTVSLVGSRTHGGPNQFAPAIRTLEGVMRIARGDWVIKGVQGEFYPCKPDIFEATYEAVDAASGSEEDA